MIDYPHGQELSECENELHNQDRKWGQQDHPDLNENTTRDFYETLANIWKNTNDRRARIGDLSWEGILLEETYEALAEEDPEKLAAELVQVAAVALQWVASIRRRKTQA